MASRQTDNLRAILTPTLLLEIYNTVLAAPGTSVEALFETFSEDWSQDIVQKLHDLTFEDVFVPLSRIPVQAYPSDMLSLLPDFHDQSFPKQALGLLLLLDQVARLTLKDHNTRWTAGFFDPFALRLTWLHLYPELTWPDAMVRCSLFTLPFTHGEDPAVQVRAQQLAATEREVVEAHFSCQDPSRSDPRAIVDDIGALPRLVREQIPPAYFAGGRYTDFFFFDCQLTRAHDPPLEAFGRYPWRNGPLGQVDSKQETGFLESIGDFARMDDKVREDIRDDVVRGVCRPLEWWPGEDAAASSGTWSCFYFRG